MDVEAPFAPGTAHPHATHDGSHPTSSSPIQQVLHARGSLRTGLLVTRALQLLFALLMAIFSGIWIGYAAIQDRQWHEEVIGSDVYSVRVTRSPAVDALVNACVVFVISLVSMALTATWTAFTLQPQARARASCFGNHTPCARFTCDLAWDIVGAVVWLALVIEFALFYASIPMIAFSVVLMVLYIAAAVMSGLQRQRIIAEEQQVQLVGTCGAATVTMAPQQYGGRDLNKHYI